LSRRVEKNCKRGAKSIVEGIIRGDLVPQEKGEHNARKVKKITVLRKKMPSTAA